MTVSSMSAWTGLQQSVETVLQLLNEEPSLGAIDLSAIRDSLKKATAPTFEIVFAGAFSAGKSMLINALLERELLYSAEGHATGTECRVAYAAVGQERVVLTFLSEDEIYEQTEILCDRLFGNNEHIDLLSIPKTQAACQQIITEEGGESKSDRAKRATALKYLLQGWLDNQAHIAPKDNRTMAMEEFNFANLQEAANYARRGTNSAVLKRVEYYCHHPLLQDGNVLVDTPGIDAPVKRDAALTYAKITDPDTAAVVCVLKTASAGDLTTEETELLEKTKHNPGIRDRVFYVFNRVDESWYNGQLADRLTRLIASQFRDTARVYKTSGLLGFYGGQIRTTGLNDRFGLDSIFAGESMPQFVNEFNRYCASSGRLPIDRFRIDVRSYESASENYTRILGSEGAPLIDQLISDSGIEAFRSGVTRYLTEEKRPLLLANVMSDLRPIAQALRKVYLERASGLRSQPTDVELLREQELQKLGLMLQKVAEELQLHIEDELNQVVASGRNEAFESQFRRLQGQLVTRLDELVAEFSVGMVHERAQGSHSRNSVVPLLGILAEAFYYLANGLEDTLVEASRDLVNGFFEQLDDRISQQRYYREMNRLVGHDGGIAALLLQAKELASLALVNAARVECDRYVRECESFFAEGTTSIFQLRETMAQACRGYDYSNMVAAEPAIRQLLKLDFEQKVKMTVLRTFRQTINQTLNSVLLDRSRSLVISIPDRYDEARSFLGDVLRREAEEQVLRRDQLLAEIEEKIVVFEGAIDRIGAIGGEDLIGKV
jgi:replication fork clamp-binding protein CrfC